jgi:arylsulfatase A-like enzyme
MVPYNAPHNPFQAKQADFDLFANESNFERRVYKAMIKSLDDGVGRLLATLDRLGIANDTIVVFTSDNGANAFLGVPSNSPFKGSKFTYTEGGLRVPCALRYPRGVAAGQRVAHPISLTDFFATFAAAASAPLMPSRVYDSVNLFDFVRNASASSPQRSDPPHRSLAWRFGWRRAIRSGEWKLCQDTRHGTATLYNLTADPAESVDLSSVHPTIVASLSHDLDSWEADNWRDPLWFYLMELDVAVDGKPEKWPV